MASLLLALLCLLATARQAWAVDNPDLPDPVAAFDARDQAVQQRLAQANATQTAAAWAEQARFLDAELNAAYQGLLARLSGTARQRLVQGQRQWLKFRDAETQFIAQQWTPQEFGSSSALTRAQLRASLVRQRVQSLLAYARSLPAP